MFHSNCPLCIVSSVPDTSITATSTIISHNCKCQTSITIITSPKEEKKETPKYKGVKLLTGNNKEKKKIEREWRKFNKKL